MDLMVKKFKTLFSPKANIYIIYESINVLSLRFKINKLF